MLHEQPGRLLGIGSDDSWDKIRPLRKPVNNNKNGIMPVLSPRQACDEVQADLLPSVTWNLQRLKKTSCLPHHGLVTLTLITASNIFCHICCHAGPYIGLPYSPKSLVPPEMTTDGRVMRLLNTICRSSGSEGTQILCTPSTSLYHKLPCL